MFSSSSSASAPSPVFLEVCVDSVVRALAAQRGGADRIELCANLVEGGTTPSAGVIRAVLEVTDLPVMVMVRPRGGDFCYDRRELYTMQCELEAVLDQAVAGVVFGALTPEGQIDSTVCRPLCQQAAGLHQTFHRAFDQTPDAQRRMQELFDLPFDRLLTSGQSATAVEGISVLRELVQSAAERIVVMPGAGIRPENARRIVQQTGAKRSISRPANWWVAPPVSTAKRFR